VALQMWSEGKSHLRDRSKSATANTHHDRMPELW
jgi:hypothetical protein